LGVRRGAAFAALELGVLDQSQEQRDDVIVEVLDDHRPGGRDLELAGLGRTECGERLGPGLYVLQPLREAFLDERQAGVVERLRAESALHVLVPLCHAHAHAEPRRADDDAHVDGLAPLDIRAEAHDAVKSGMVHGSLGGG